MLYLCFAADYELFSGSNYLSEHETLIEPTGRLLERLEGAGAKLSIMVDALCLMKYRQEGLLDFAREAEEQLVDAVGRGHDVQLNVHPHWITSAYEDGRWRYDDRRYRIHAFGFDDKDGGARMIIRMSKQYLEKLVRKEEPLYSCCAYRAGGLCIQREDKLIKALVAEGIWIDTNVVRGLRRENPCYSDFTSAPDSINWWVGPKWGVCAPVDRGPERMFEVPTGSYWKMPSMWRRKVITGRERRNIKIAEHVKRGECRVESLTRSQRFVRRMDDFFLQPIVLSYESSCCEEMIWIVDKYLERFDCDSRDHYLIVSGQPKNLFDYALEETSKFCNVISRCYSKRVGFATLSEVAQKVGRP